MWYSHFDLVASFLSSYAPTLGKEWFHAIHKYNTVQVEQRPDDIDLRIMVLQNKHKVLAMDMAMLFHQLAKKQMNVADFMAEQQQICEALRQERTALDPMLTNPEHLTQPFPDAPSPKSLIQPDIPGQLYTGPLWQMNFFILDSLSMEMMHKIQVAKMTGREPPPEVRQIALEICRIFGIIEHWKGSPPGAILSCHAALGIAALVLAHDEQHIMWFRRKFALIESQGYVSSLHVVFSRFAFCPRPRYYAICLVQYSNQSFPFPGTPTLQPSATPWLSCGISPRSTIGGSPTEKATRRLSAPSEHGPRSELPRRT